LKPFQKPYKYLSLNKASDGNMETDSFVAYDDEVDPKNNEIFEEPHCKVEKILNNKLNEIQVVNDRNNQKYVFEFKQKKNLISTISNLFVETIYGVQKKLYTDWTVIVDIMIENIKCSSEDYVWHIFLLRNTLLQLTNRLEMNALHELIAYLIIKLGEE